MNYIYALCWTEPVIFFMSQFLGEVVCCHNEGRLNDVMYAHTTHSSVCYPCARVRMCMVACRGLLLAVIDRS